jgi:hypothetical protein
VHAQPRKHQDGNRWIRQVKIVTRTQPPECYLMGIMEDAAAAGGKLVPRRVVGVTHFMTPSFKAVAESLKTAIEQQNLTKAEAIALRDRLVKKAAAKKKYIYIYIYSSYVNRGSRT